MPQTKNIHTIKRQKEIKHAINCLLKYNPTKVALEVLTENQTQLNQEYKAYLAGEFQLIANERHQFGFQLAKESGHKELFAVDWNDKNGDVPQVDEWVSENNSKRFDEVAAKGQAMKVESERYFNSHTMKEYLRWLNDRNNVQSNHSMYMKLALIGNENMHIGAMWTAQYWYFRNMVIYKNLVDLVTSDHERIFVLYGAGHLYLLNQFLQESEIFNVEYAQDYLT
ncbi:DUF5694 domain-containing protein [Virgibacillus flavescens]|uniref:DUF5694 domain-containing protein n=1 Tax=Virgibacillus flavescens TaxID=1611422 RepID=UPI003D34FC47